MKYCEKFSRHVEVDYLLGTAFCDAKRCPYKIQKNMGWEGEKIGICPSFGIVEQPRTIENIISLPEILKMRIKTADSPEPEMSRDIN